MLLPYLSDLSLVERTSSGELTAETYQYRDTIVSTVLIDPSGVTTNIPSD
jgi:hypothetical protein